MREHHKEILNNLMDEFSKIYPEHLPTRHFFAPGRVNLIGEHIDYNGGHALPCAIESGTYAIVSLRDDSIINFASTNFDLTVSCSSDNIKYEETHDWANYPKGVINEFISKGLNIPGMNLLFFGNIPNGAGLSSSASIEMVTAVLLNTILSASCNMLDLVKISQSAENNFVGVSCGVMDQFSIGFGEKDACISLNCNTLEYSTVPLNLEEYFIVIMNTNKKRGLGDTGYMKRQDECKEALLILKKEFNIQHLCDLSSTDLQEIEIFLKNNLLFKRVRHAISENERVLKSQIALTKGNLIEFGKLLSESHNSLKTDFEVTGKELDAIVDAALSNSSVLGARMTGAGFGGCAIALVKKPNLKEFKKQTSEQYRNATGLEASFYISKAGEGAGELS